jgi:hypothetical protein
MTWNPTDAELAKLAHSLPGHGHFKHRTNLRRYEDKITIGTKLTPEEFQAPDGFSFFRKDGDYFVWVRKIASE